MMVLLVDENLSRFHLYLIYHKCIELSIENIKMDIEIFFLYERKKTKEMK